MVQRDNWMSVQLVMRNDIRSSGSIVVTQHKLLLLDAIRSRVKTIANSIGPCEWHSITAGPLGLLSHLFLLSWRQQSHFHKKLSYYFCWQVIPAWFFLIYFPNFSPKREDYLSQVGVQREVQAADKTRWVHQPTLDEGFPFRQAEIKLLSFGL